MEIINNFCSTGDFTIIHRLNGESLKIEDVWSDIEERYTCKWPILKKSFKKDIEIKNLIQNADIEDIIRLMIRNDGTDAYTLNIHSVENWASLGIEGERWMAKRQMEIYMPIIKYFLQNGFRNLFGKFSTVLTSPVRGQNIVFENGKRVDELIID